MFTVQDCALVFCKWYETFYYFPNNSLTKTLSVNHIPNSMKNNKFIGMNWSIIDWFSVDEAILFFSVF